MSAFECVWRIMTGEGNNDMDSTLTGNAAFFCSVEDVAIDEDPANMVRKSYLRYQ